MNESPSPSSQTPAAAPPSVAAPPSRWQRLSPRVRASLSWLGVSLVVGILAVGLVFLVWYPGELAYAAGAVPIFGMMFGIDLVLGPVVILLIFNPNKRSLRFDVTVVALVQIAALCYGLYSIFVGRPAFVVYNVDRFDIVLNNAYDPASAARAKNPQYQSTPLFGPLTVGAKLPTDREARNHLLLQAAGGGYDLPQLPEFYCPLADVADAMRRRMKPIDALRKSNDKASPALLAKLDAYAKQGDAVGFVPVRGRVHDLAAIIDRKTATVIEMLPLEPW